jgi:hypothetical protein
MRCKRGFCTKSLVRSIVVCASSAVACPGRPGCHGILRAIFTMGARPSTRRSLRVRPRMTPLGNARYRAAPTDGQGLKVLRFPRG